MNYRREIDGLRALAVLPVILFHAGIAGFGGGFVGVDIFFVISGYLITSIILGELAQGQFSILRFYERRARRILPALFVVMLLCLPLAWVLLLPGDMKAFAQSLSAVALFASNFLFWQESGYFESATELKPLLHTWSLAVEEQYYLLFPLWLMLTWKLGRRWLVASLGLMLVASLTLAQWASHAKPEAAFYLLPTRGWELLLGALTAVYLARADRPAWGHALGEWGAALGVGLIAYAVFCFRKDTPFPGLYALVPTLGAGLIVLMASPQTVVGRCLGSRALVGVGLVSYSAYLWHQPLFAMARHAGVANSQKGVFAALIVLTLLLAYVSWRLVEVPFRRGPWFGRRAVFAGALLGTVGFVALGLVGQYRQGDLGQVSAEQKRFLAHFENDLPTWNYFTRTGMSAKVRNDCNFFDIPQYRAGQLSQVPLESIDVTCHTRQVPGAKAVFIWGDSHAQQLHHGLSQSLPPGFEVLQVASSSCEAAIVAAPDKANYCDHSNWFALQRIAAVKPEVVVVGQDQGHDARHMQALGTALTKLGVGRVIFTGPTPHWTPSLPAVVARLLPDVPRRSFDRLDRGVMALDRQLKQSTQGATKVEYLSLIDYFCNDQGCLMHLGGDELTNSVTSYDYGHLTPVASLHLARDLLVPVIMGVRP